MIITVAVYGALQVWNGSLFPLILTQSTETTVPPLGLVTFQGEFTANVPRCWRPWSSPRCRCSRCTSSAVATLSAA